MVGGKKSFLPFLDCTPFVKFLARHVTNWAIPISFVRALVLQEGRRKEGSIRS